MNEKQITQTNIAGTLIDYVESISKEDLLKLYNQLCGADYDYDEVDWES